MKRTLIALACCIAPLMSHAKQAKLEVALSQPVLEANRKHTTFIKVSLTGVQQQGTQRTSTNVAIVLDRSGSMRGTKLRQAKNAAIHAIKQLSPNDIVSVISYDHTVDVVVPATKLTDKSFVIERIRSLSARGNTALFAGVSKGSAEVQKFAEENEINRVILLSDGMANVGPSSPSALGKLGASLGKQGITVTTIGLGLGYNEDLMAQLANYSDGNHVFAKNSSDLKRIFNAEFGELMMVVATDVTVEIQCAEGVRPVRVLGREASIIDGKVTTRINNLLSGHERYVMLEVEVPAGKAGQSRDMASVAVKYNNLVTTNGDKLRSTVAARYSDSSIEAQQAVNLGVYEEALEQVANTLNEQAISLKDKGQHSKAKELIQGYANMLEDNSEKFNSSKLKALAEEAQRDSDELESRDWNEQRKDLKGRNYSRSKQQTYQ